jgi:hypothetical protein
MFHLNKKYPYEIEVNNVALMLINNFLINNSSHLKILDVGCGYGMLLNELLIKQKLFSIKLYHIPTYPESWFIDLKTLYARASALSRGK